MNRTRLPAQLSLVIVLFSLATPLALHAAVRSFAPNRACQLQAALASQPGGGAWAHSYGGQASDYASALAAVDGGGYIIAGTTNSFGSSGSAGWVLRIDAQGSVVWQKRYDSQYNEGISAVLKTSDGYLLAGYTTPGNDQRSDAWVLKISPAGAVEWERRYGLPLADERASALAASSDGGFFVTGTATTVSPIRSSQDVLLLKLDAKGRVLWQKSYGSPATEESATAMAITDVDNQMLIIVGHSFTLNAPAALNAWAMKISAAGAIEWKTSFDSGGYDTVTAVVPTGNDGSLLATDSDYLLAGYTGPGAPFDAWLIRLGAEGSIQWQRRYGAGLDERFFDLVPAGGGYVAVGRTTSFGLQNGDVWALGLEPDGDISWQRSYGGANYDLGSAVVALPDGLALAGQTASSGAGGDDFWLLQLPSDGTFNATCTRSISTGGVWSTSTAGDVEPTFTMLTSVLQEASTSVTVLDTLGSTSRCAPPSPTPSPSPTPNPVPSPTPNPVPSPTPNPVPSPTPNPVPSPSPDPETSYLLYLPLVRR